MRHAILGAGAVGLCLAADLARTGAPVSLVMRPTSLAAYSGTVCVRVTDGATVRLQVPAADRLARPVDVIWVVVKSPHLETALDAVEDTTLSGALVVPLLNGIDHVAALRTAYGARVIAGAAWIDAHRTGIGEAVRRSPHTQVDLAVADPGDPVAARLIAGLRAAGVTCRHRPGDAEVLWHKLCVLVPLALATAAAVGTLAAVRRDPALHDLMWRCAGEVRAAAATHGVPVTESQVRRRLAALADDVGSSLQRDAQQGRPLELAAISDPVLATGVSAAATEQLVRLIAHRSATSVS